MRNIVRYAAAAGMCAALLVPVAAHQLPPFPPQPSSFPLQPSLFPPLPPSLLQQPQPQPTQRNPDRITVPFSDPTRPGALKLKLLQGSVVVKGTNRRDVSIQGGPGTELSRTRAVEPPAGLRRLTQPAGFSVEESNNEMSLSATRFNRNLDLQIEVPVKTNLDLSLMNGSAITVEDVEGELEISNLNGAIVLKNVSGSVVAHSMNGSVTAVVTRVTAQAPMSFTSMNGTVDVTLPPAIKANLKLRSDQGDVFTDFDFQVTQGVQPEVRKGDRFRIDVNRSIYGTVNGGGPDVELRSFNGTVILRKAK
jgi:hypothetical protein